MQLLCSTVVRGCIEGNTRPFEERENAFFLSCPFLVRVLHIDGYYQGKRVNLLSAGSIIRECSAVHVLAFYLK